MNRVDSGPNIIVRGIGPQIPPPPRMGTPFSVASKLAPSEETDGSANFMDKYSLGKQSK
jgi:hypothetical protein